MFSLDPRGGHNRYTFNKDFFKKWTSEMAYVLGFMYADGNITDSVSSRTQYISFDSNDEDILKKIKKVLFSNHKIQNKPGRISIHQNGLYESKRGFRLRIGSREMFRDLINLGLTPRKSLTIKFPESIPAIYLNHFIRGYFDGDGCVHILREKGRHRQSILKGLKVIFTSGSKLFLEELKIIIEKNIFKNGKIYYISGAYQLKYPTSDSVKFFEFLYNNCSEKLFLKRKFNIFTKYFKLRPNSTNDKIMAMWRS